jgi:membrane-bound inhibitor of C-type lysozyme
MGMTEEICGVCLKGAKPTEATPKFLENKAAALAAFKTSNKNFGSQQAEMAAFNKYTNNEFVWWATKAGDAKMPTTRTEALQYIFKHQDKIGLPFCLA